MESNPATGVSQEILDGLNDLLQLDHDAIGAYNVAIDKLENPDYAEQIRGFRADHERHVRDLNELITQHGGTPANEPHATGPFKKALQGLGAAGGDKGLLVSWRTNELQVRTKYDGYASKAVGWPADVKRVIDRNALDEERHYRWVADTLQDLGVGAGEGPETQLATRAREAAGQAGQVAQQARARVGEAAESARGRLADGLEGAADRLDRLADQQEAAGGARARAGTAAHRVADGLEGAADSLRSGGGGGPGLAETIEEQARTRPLQTLAGALALGFVIGRIIR